MKTPAKATGEAVRQNIKRELAPHSYLDHSYFINTYYARFWRREIQIVADKGTLHVISAKEFLSCFILTISKRYYAVNFSITHFL